MKEVQFYRFALRACVIVSLAIFFLTVAGFSVSTNLFLSVIIAILSLVSGVITEIADKESAKRQQQIEQRVDEIERDRESQKEQAETPGSSDSLPKRLEAELVRAEAQLRGDEAASNSGVAAVAVELRESVERLRVAQQDLHRAETAVDEIERQAEAALIRAPYHLGLPCDIKGLPPIRFKKKPVDPR